MQTRKKLPEYAVAPEGGGYTLYRDGVAMMTPRALPLRVAHKKLAEAMLHECLAQSDERLDLRRMPMTQMALTALDVAPLQRVNIIDGIMRYGENELVCLRAEQPAELAAEQARVWQPYLDWCGARFNVTFAVASGGVAVAQTAETLAAARNFVDELDDYHLIGISESVGISGSLILGLALATGHSDAAAVFAAAELDQLWQMRKWGEDPAVTARHQDIQRDLGDCARWFSLV